MVGYYFLRLDLTAARKIGYIALKFNNHDASCYPQQNAAASLKRSAHPHRIPHLRVVIRSKMLRLH